MTEETPDLDRLLARLSEQRQNPGELEGHLSAEKLSAYQAGEVPSEENDAIQEHLAYCALCTGMLRDLQRFLEPPPEDLPREGVADFEMEAEWRQLRAKLREAQAQNAAVRRGLFRRISGAPAVAAVLAILLVGAAYRIAVLQGELARPTVVQITTVEAQGSKKGVPGAAEATPFRLGNVAIFDTHSERPYPNYRLSFRDKDGLIRAAVEAQEDENGMIALLLPRSFLTPGRYHIQVLGLEGATANPIREFNIRILQ